MTHLHTILPNLIACWDRKDKIRNALNSNAHTSRVLGDNRWQLANGGLDAIDDASTALWTYFDMDWPAGGGAQLLSIYGFFQAAIIQQDGVFELLAAMNKTNLKKELQKAVIAYPVLDQNRDLRDRLVGHPANKNRGTKNPTAGTFNRHVPDRMAIVAAVYSINTGLFQRVVIDTLHFIEKQSGALNSLLQPAVPWAMNPI